MRLFRRPRPETDLEDYAAARDLRHRDADTVLLGTGVALLGAGERFDVAIGRLPGGEHGALCHVVAESSRGDQSGTLHEPRTVAAFPASDLVGALLRVTYVPGVRLQPHMYLRATTAPLPALIAPAGDDGVLAAALGGGAATALAATRTELHVLAGCLWLSQPGFAQDAELDALAQLGSGIVRRAREAAFARAGAADFATPLPAPRWPAMPPMSATERLQSQDGQGLDTPLWPPLDDFVARFPAQRGYVAEDALTFHRAFPAAPLRGQAFAVFRGPVGGREGRLVATNDIRLPEAHGLDAALLPAPAGLPDLPPGDVEQLDDACSLAVGGGVVSVMRPRPDGVVSGPALVELGEYAAALADRRGW